MRKIPLTKPYITEDMKASVCEVLDSGYLTEGPVTREFEASVREYIGCGHALAVCNCTVGLEMALRALGIGPGDEVIVPDYTYPATADVVQIVGAEIVLVDVSPETMLIDYDGIEDAITDRTKAIMPVSIFGNPLDYDRLGRIKEKRGVYIIEDAACSLGAEYRGIKVGNQADISVFSLHPRKFITTGEGGIVTTDNRHWAEWMLSYKHFGMRAEGSRLGPDFCRVGSNYKLSNILAAVGLSQMGHIDELLDKRLVLAQNYIELLSQHQSITVPKTTDNGKHSRQSFCIHVEDRDRLLEKMRADGIEVQIGTYALHMQKAFRDSPGCRILGDMAGSRSAFERCLTLPLYHELTYQDQEHVAGSLLDLLG